ncbi:hypothetical protein [Roseovarius indicus]|uniref:hypothetical protein n=1 Tax=Roseovarius indicus TaxID=540747 RepID=UPI000A8187C5|nr:hypothetical protein [Roseovarius indicus]
MNTYVVAYDLSYAGQNYECLTRKLRAYGTYCHLQQSAWLIESSQTAVQVRDNLSACLDGNDRLFVAELSGEAAWTGYDAATSKWIKETA